MSSETVTTILFEENRAVLSFYQRKITNQMFICFTRDNFYHDTSVAQPQSDTVVVKLIHSQTQTF